MPTFWTVATQVDFLKGDVEDLSIDSDGRVFLGPSTSLVAETAAPFLWTVVAGADGTFWAGTGNEGKVLKIGKDGKAATFFDATELEVHAIVQAPNNGLYVGTSPDGKIYHVSADGTARPFFDPEDKYIWALALDRAGNLYAATGDKGVIYKITPDGKGTRFYKTSSTNVVSLAFSSTGDLFAGTESPGRVFRIDATGKAFVLLDSPFKEIHSLRMADDGTLYAAAVSGSTSVTEDRSIQPAGADPGRAPVPTVSTEITAISVVDAGVSQATTPVISGASRRSNRGAVYRIRSNGLWDTYWETGEDSPYDLLVEPGGSLLVGTGPEGKIFRVSGDPARATLLSRATARQVTALLREPSGRIVGATSNPGKLFALSASPAAKGSYESDVRDAGTVASWGVIRWRATARAGQVQLLTRTGNTANPDETWSAWSKPYSSADGEQIGSPNARYLQWRALLSADNAPSPVLTSVTAAYLPRNLRPEVSSITVHPAGTVFQRPFSGSEVEIAGFEENTSDGRAPSQAQSGPGGAPPLPPPLGRRIYQKGLQTIVWKAEDFERRPAAVRRLVSSRRRDRVESPQARHLGPDLRVGHDVGARRNVCRARHRVGRSVERAGHGPARRPGKRQLRHRQHRAADRDAAGAPCRNAFDDRVHRPRRPVPGTARRVLARREPLAHGLPEGRHPGFPSRGLRGGGRRQRGRPQRHHSRDRRHEQRRDGRRDAPAVRGFA